MGILGNLLSRPQETPARKCPNMSNRLRLRQVASGPNNPRSPLLWTWSPPGRRGDVDDVIGELRLELARDAKITGHGPIEFYLRAVGRELSLPGDFSARKIRRVTAEQFPLWDALR